MGHTEVITAVEAYNPRHQFNHAMLPIIYKFMRGKSNNISDSSNAEVAISCCTISVTLPKTQTSRTFMLYEDHRKQKSPDPY